MSDQTPDDLDATPPYGIVGGTRSGAFFRTSRMWFVVVLLALMVLTLLIRLS